MSIRALLALVIGIVLALGGLAVLVWLLWKLWTQGEREKEVPAVEYELEPPPATEPPQSRQPVGFAPAVERVPAPAAAEEPAAAAAPGDLIVEEPAAQAPLPGAADDLKLIEGIGPKIAGVLAEAGILRFAQLAASDVDRLRSILGEADHRLLRLADPTTWPQQARLAAAGEWDALTELQESLRAGRRVR